MSDDDRLIGKLEAGIETISDNQTTIMSEFREHRREMADVHTRVIDRLGVVEADVDRVEAKVDGHASEDDKRFSLLWRISLGGSGGIAAIFAMLKIVGY